MDRIQKALDKAKAKQAQTVSSGEKVQVVNGQQSAEQFSEQASSTIDNISYSQTRVKEVTQAYLEDNRIIAGIYRNSQSAIFRMLRTQVLQKMRTNDWQTLAVTSPTANEGKSVVASNLAVAIAMELNQTVMLVDMDLRKPSLSQYFDLGAKLGLVDYLQKDIDLKDVLVNPGIKRMVILPGVGRAEDSAELLSSPKMANLVEDLKAQYDSRLIIFDVPPLLQTDDVLLSSNYFDSSLLVLEDGANREADIIRALQFLDGTNLIGTVLNKADNIPSHQTY